MTEPKTALVVVDMQTAFVAPEGALSVPGAPAVLAAVNAEVADAVAHGRPILYTRDIAPTDLPVDDADAQASLAAGLDVRGAVVDKGPGRAGGMSGFVLQRNHPGGGGISELASLLTDADVTHLRVVGLAADVCVAATCADARRLGYDVTLVRSATAFVHAHPDGDLAALAELSAAGVHVR